MVDDSVSTQQKKKVSKHTRKLSMNDVEWKGAFKRYELYMNEGG